MLKTYQSSFDFLIEDFDYILSESSSDEVYGDRLVYKNEKAQREISITYDKIDNSLGLIVWRLFNGERNLINRRYYLTIKDLLEINPKNPRIIELPEPGKTKAKNVIDVLNLYKEILLEVGIEIINGNDWRSVPWADDHNKEFPRIII